MTSSHNHTNHLNAETLSPLIASNPHLAFVTPEDDRKFVGERIERNVDFGLDDGETIEIVEL